MNRATRVVAKVFVDIEVVGSSDYQLGWWAAAVTGGIYNKILNKIFSVTTRATCTSILISSFLFS